MLPTAEKIRTGHLLAATGVVGRFETVWESETPRSSPRKWTRVAKPVGIPPRDSPSQTSRRTRAAFRSIWPQPPALYGTLPR